MALIVVLYPENFKSLSKGIKKIEINLWWEDNMSRSSCKNSLDFQELQKDFDKIFSEEYDEKCKKAFKDFEVSKPKDVNWKEAIYYLHDNIKCLKEHGETKFNDMEFKNLEYLSMQSNFGIYFKFKKAAILRIGNFLENDIYQIFSSEINLKKIYIYSASDDILASILVIFNLLKPESEWPQFGSHIIFELYEDSKKSKLVLIKYGENEVLLKLDVFKSKFQIFF